MDRKSTALGREIALVFWVCLGSWYYGYHISELNFPAPSLLCSASPSTTTLHTTLNPCIIPDESIYSLVTACFNLGGLIGSIASANALERRGWKGTILVMGGLNALGAGLMGGGNYWWMLGIGRFLGGLSSGLAVCTVPPLLSHLSSTSPHSLLSCHSGSIGILNQIGIVVGILCAQLAGLAFTGMKGEERGGWRGVVLASGVVALGQVGVGLMGFVKPGELEGRTKEGTKDREAHRERMLRTESADLSENEEMNNEEVERQADPAREDSPLLQSPSSSSVLKPVSISSVFSDPVIRPSVLLVCFIMASQQLSGINAVLFYSTPVLKGILGGSAGLIGIGVSAMNVVSTFPPLFLVDRIGRKRIIQYSLLGMILSSILLYYGLDNHHPLLSSISILLFVASFASGLGPVPFLLISELVPPQAIPATASLALSISWIMSFGIASAFLPLRNALAKGEGEGEGNVFLIFVGCQVTALVVISRFLYRK